MPLVKSWKDIFDYFCRNGNKKIILEFLSQINGLFKTLDWVNLLSIPHSIDYLFLSNPTLWIIQLGINKCDITLYYSKHSEISLAKS